MFEENSGYWTKTYYENVIVFLRNEKKKRNVLKLKEVKLGLEQAIRAQRRGWGIALLFI